MLNIRVSNFGENALGEQEQDANFSLTELDKGLRSGCVGEQCEAIVKFPRLFERYPFPILINASFLKLADIFRTGNNFLRLWVLRVCQQNDKHLDKISNVDEFIRRVYSVIYSNDPIARALTLRTLGALAGIIPERQQVHHSIRRSLDSHDNVEVEAAIYAAEQFASQSKTFAVSMCNKISDMIQGQATPANMKLQLIPILQYMHHDTSTSAMIRELCTNLLPSYPAQDFVIVTLNTLTQLAAATLVDIPNQVSLLLTYLRTDPRLEVKSKCLQHLYLLAKPGAHLWPYGAIDKMVDVALKTLTTPQALSLALDVIEVLAESSKVCYDYRTVESKLRKFCSKNSFSSHSAIAAQAIKVLVRILTYCYQENLEAYGVEDVTLALEALIVILTISDLKSPYQLKVALKCAVQLSAAKKEHCEQFVNLLGSSLKSVDGESRVLICEALGAIGGLQAEPLLSLLPNIVQLLHELSELTNPNEQQTKTQVMLCTLIFQTLSEYQWNKETIEAVQKVTANSNLWANYRIARAAVRYGHHTIGLSIFTELTEQVSSESLHFWLVCLKEMCEAEAKLSEVTSDILVDKLNLAVIHYNKSIAALKAASASSHNLQFQTEYMHIRMEFLQCLIQLIHTTNILCIVPPPAIASTIVQATRDEYQRHGYITNQMRKCIKEFKNCGELYWKLYQTAFDADPATLENVQILQQMCAVIESCVANVCIAGNKFVHDPSSFGFSRLESQQLVQGCQKAVDLTNSINEDVTCQTITHKHIDTLRKVIEVIVKSALPVPRYFFQILQSTTLKLAISPQARVMGEFISVQPGSQLAVKVEGVVQHGQRPGLFRQVEEVLITVSSQLQANSKNKEVSDVKSIDPNIVLSQTVSPHKDFFTAQFLLAFMKGGQYVLTIEASVVDQHSNVWRTGPRSALTVKVPEETKPMPIAMPGMSTTVNNVILMTDDNVYLRPNSLKN